ncbi:metal ABC transporter substrate-binding protein (plasmid) [Roseomonas gilardii]|uniref:Metal ABC transporter substrate-binding protein n=1 Tax=Roseomonas gilardii TaxID=257708 RepID=A0A1L7AN52_9PROT|nr:metal ABC transporter substrate-binding protein [Roseomonas gilardii]APT60196.1 metal ABC transporter substrate-binding protein [Roseomonas gilardii]
MKRRYLMVGAALAVMAFAQPALAKTLEAVASFTVLADMVHQVGGERVHVVSLVGPNGDPHVYEPSPDDARHLKAADIVFVSGLGLEGWMDRLISASGYAGKPVVASDGIRTLRMEEDGRKVTDPHAWNSAANGVIYVHNIVRALSAADPAGAAAYQENGDRYARQLEQLDDYARRTMEAIPLARRKVLTTHDAFGYFADRYKVTFLSPLGISTESEPSAQQMAKLIEQIRSEHVRAYFFENSNDSRLVQQIARATGAKPGGELYVEALSPPDGPAPTYAAMFRYNVDQLAAAMRDGKM